MTQIRKCEICTARDVKPFRVLLCDAEEDSELSEVCRAQADGSPPCVNGDIAIQWEWSNFNPSQNQNP